MFASDFCFEINPAEKSKIVFFGLGACTQPSDAAGHETYILRDPLRQHALDIHLKLRWCRTRAQVLGGRTCRRFHYVPYETLEEQATLL